MYLLHRRRDGYDQAFLLHMFDNVNYVLWCIVHRASVIMLEYMSANTDIALL